MDVEIDVSGADLFHENYSICVSDGEGSICGYKFTADVVDKLKEGYSRGKYTRLPKSTRLGKFKVKIYLIVLRHLISELVEKNGAGTIKLTFCRDFPSHENSIKRSIEHQLKNVHGKTVIKIKCGRLDRCSDAHLYAYMMNKDQYNYLSCYCGISLNDIEKLLILKK